MFGSSWEDSLPTTHLHQSLQTPLLQIDDDDDGGGYIGILKSHMIVFLPPLLFFGDSVGSHRFSMADSLKQTLYTQ